MTAVPAAEPQSNSTVPPKLSPTSGLERFGAEVLGLWRSHLEGLARTPDALPERWHDPVVFVREVLGHRTWGLQDDVLRAMRKPNARVSVKGCHNSSKALAVNTPIPTPDGWKRIADVRIGDVVFDERGSQTPVIATSPVTVRESYRVTFDTGQEIVACDEHLWNVIDMSHRPRRVGDWRNEWGRTRTVTTAEMARCVHVGGQRRWRIPLCSALDVGGPWPLRHDPYTFGAWLGDGDSNRAAVTVGEGDLGHFACALSGGVTRIVRPKNRALRIYFDARPHVGPPSREIGGAKRIPQAALRASRGDRLMLLRGLMDSDGHVSKGRSACFSNTSAQLIEDVRELVNGLGYKAYVCEQRAMLYGRDCGPTFLVTFAPDICPFLLPRKAERWQTQADLIGRSSRATQRTIVSVEPVGRRAVCCIGVASPSNLYLAGRDMIPTHNTHLAGELVVWWVAMEGGTALTTAPGYRQVKRVMWAQKIRPFIRLSGITHGAFGLRLPQPNLTDWTVADDNYALGMSTDAASQFQGWKGRVLLVVDEAQGVRADVFEALESYAGGDVRVIMIGNALRVGGPFYDSFVDQRSEWDTFSIGAFDTPNLSDLVPQGKTAAECDDAELIEVLEGLSEDEMIHEPFPGLITRGYVRQRIGTGRWDTRVMARFPRHQADAMITLDVLEHAAALPSLMDDDAEERRDLVVAVDVAESGPDETVVVIRRGRHLVGLHAFPEADARGPVARLLKQYRSRLLDVRVDADGVGAYFARHLDDLGYPVTRIHSGASPVGLTRWERELAADDYLNLRAQMWDSLRSKLEEGRARGITDREAVAQLAYVRRETASGGQIKIESKKSMKARGLRSPDRADALVYCFFDFPDEDDGGDLIW